MGPLRAAALLGVLALLTAGCASEPTLRLDNGERVNAREVKVGEARFGDYIRTETNASGTRLNDGDPEPFSETRYTERWIEGPNATTDQFLRPINAVRLRLRETNLEVKEGDRGVYSLDLLFDVATKRLVRQSGTQDAGYAIDMCLAPYFSCDNVRHHWDEEYQYYPRESREADWGSLAGRTLRVGETVSFHEDRNSSLGPYTYYVNFTARRVENVGEERAMLVEWSQQVHFAQQEKPTSSPSPSPSPTSTEKPRVLPKAVHRQWYSARLPIPIRSLNSEAYFAGGEVLWFNSTSHVQDSRRGAAAVAWGSGAAHPAAEWMPGTEHVPYVQFRDTVAAPLRYSLAEAWNNARADITLSGFQSYMESHADAYPFASVYVPDDAHGAYTWTMVVSTPGKRASWTVESRLNLVAGVPVVQNREDNAGFSFLIPPPADATRDVELATFKDVVKNHEVFTGRTAPPMLVVLLTSWRFDPVNTFDPLLVFIDPETLYQKGPGGALGHVWASKGTVTFSLRDGGISGINNSVYMGKQEWPWVPFFSYNGGQSAAADELDAWLRGIVTRA